MIREVNVHLLPVLIEPAEVRGGIAVVIDKLRASKAITHAPANGGRRVVPCRGSRCRAEPFGCTLPEGEGVPVDGFDLDSKPATCSRSFPSTIRGRIPSSPPAPDTPSSTTH